MIINQTEFWVWLGLLSIGVYVLIHIIHYLLMDTPFIGDYLDEDGYHESDILAKIFSPIRWAIHITSLVLPAFFIYSFFESRIDTTVFEKDNGHLQQERFYTYETTALLGLPALAIGIGLANEPRGDLENFTTEEFNIRIKSALEYDNVQLFINQTDAPIHASITYYFSNLHMRLHDMAPDDFDKNSSEWRLKQVVDAKMQEHVDYGKVIEGFGYIFEQVPNDFNVGCRNPLPDSYSFPPEEKEDPLYIGYLNYFTEVSEFECEPFLENAPKTFDEFDEF